MESIIDKKQCLRHDDLIHEAIAVMEFYRSIDGAGQRLTGQSAIEAYKIIMDIAKEQMRRDRAVQEIKSRVDSWRSNEILRQKQAK